MKSVWIGILILLAALALPVALTPAPVFADEHIAARSWQGTVRVKNLNVRGGPGEGHDIVARLKRGNKVNAVDQTGRWVRIVGIKEKGASEDSPDIEAWVHRSFVRLPKNFLAPTFGDAENSFVDWAIARGDLLELSVESSERLSLVLAEETDKALAPGIALEVGCAYREQLKVKGTVVVTVWTTKGAAASWRAQASCP
jgi:hypothetical protein